MAHSYNNFCSDKNSMFICTKYNGYYYIYTANYKAHFGDEVNHTSSMKIQVICTGSQECAMERILGSPGKQSTNTLPEGIVRDMVKYQ